MRDLGLDKASEVDLARTVFREIGADGSGAIQVDEIGLCSELGCRRPSRMKSWPAQTETGMA